MDWQILGEYELEKLGERSAPRLAVMMGYYPIHFVWKNFQIARVHAEGVYWDVLE